MTEEEKQAAEANKAAEEEAKKEPVFEMKPIIKFKDRFDVMSNKPKKKEKKAEKGGEFKPWKIIENPLCEGVKF
jgi:hypothetical protein